MNARGSAEFLRQAEGADQEEARRYGADCLGDELAEELRRREAGSNAFGKRGER